MPTKSTLVVPLYIYPLTPETWAPLYTAIESYPTLPFLIIINPNSGSGATAVPDSNYIREINRLNTYPNVRTIRYIRIDYCSKPLDACLAEIDRYAGWSDLDQDGDGKLAMQGIFVDKTLNHYTAERAMYLGSLRECVKAHRGILGDKLVVHNPGTAPAASLACLADVVFVCEESYERYRSVDVQRWLAIHPIERQRAGFIVSGVHLKDVERVACEVRVLAEYVFVTEIGEGFYEAFGEAWGLLCRVLAETE